MLIKKGITELEGLFEGIETFQAQERMRLTQRNIGATPCVFDFVKQGNAKILWLFLPSDEERRECQSQNMTNRQQLKTAAKRSESTTTKIDA